MKVAMFLALTALVAALCLPYSMAEKPLEVAPYIMQFKPGNQPWENNATAFTASSSVVDWTTAVLTLGPCVYREMHWHANADENLYVISGDQVETWLGFPNNTGVSATLKAGDGFIYPIGYPHYQFNANCNEAAKMVTNFNSATPGTFGSVGSLQAAPQQYRDSAFAEPLPKSGGLWARQQECVKQCGLSK